MIAPYRTAIGTGVDFFSSHLAILLTEPPVVVSQPSLYADDGCVLAPLSGVISLHTFEFKWLTMQARNVTEPLVVSKQDGIEMNGAGGDERVGQF